MCHVQCTANRRMIIWNLDSLVVVRNIFEFNWNERVQCTVRVREDCTRIVNENRVRDERTLRRRTRVFEKIVSLFFTPNNYAKYFPLIRRHPVYTCGYTYSRNNSDRCLEKNASFGLTRESMPKKEFSFGINNTLYWRGEGLKKGVWNIFPESRACLLRKLGSERLVTVWRDKSKFDIPRRNESTRESFREQRYLVKAFRDPL